MGITYYYRTQKVNGKIEIHHAFCFDREYETLFVSEDIESNEYDKFREDNYDMADGNEFEFWGLVILLNDLKYVLSEQDFKRFQQKIAQFHCPSVIDRYNEYHDEMQYSDDEE